VAVNQSEEEGGQEVGKTNQEVQVIREVLIEVQDT
jgi:hypothetical protein